MGGQLLAADSPNYFDLADFASLARPDEPMTALCELKGLVVTDEVQRLTGSAGPADTSLWTLRRRG